MREIAHGALLFAGGLAAAMPLSSFAALQTNVVERHYDRFGRPVGVSLNGERRTEIAYDEATGRIASMRVAGAEFAYHYDDIGNRLWSREFGTNCAYVANELNQYTNIVRGGVSELSAFDLDGNQTNVVTATGEWAVEYNGENRPVLWRRKSDGATIRMAYDRLGRRVRKNDETFVYDGYLNISQTVWDPTEPIATRALVWRGAGGNAFYFHDGNKNVADLVPVSSVSAIRHYDYAPFGGNIGDVGGDDLPWLFSSEFEDCDLGLAYYNYRHYSSAFGRWLSFDPIEEVLSAQRPRGESHLSLAAAPNLLCYVGNAPVSFCDFRGLACGSGWNEPFVPDAPGGFNFETACQNHDDCYGTCGSEKGDCDSQFLKDMMSVCQKAPFSYETLCFSEYTHTYYSCKIYPREQCKGYARTYYFFVDKLGQGPFDKAQEDCCNGKKK